MKKLLLLLTFISLVYVGVGQTTTIDFETDGDGYTASSTEGSGDTDVFNRSNPNIGGNSSYIWAVEDISLSDPSITLDAIDITGSASFDFSIDFLTPNSEDWDTTDELLITYTVDGGSSQNLMWVQSNEDGDAFNAPAALDTDFDGTGDDGNDLPAIEDDFGAGVGSNFETFTANINSISGSSMVITLQFNGLTSSAEGIYLDNITITQSDGSGNNPPSISNIAQSPSSDITSSDAVSVSADVTDSDGTISNVELNWGTTSGSLGNTINMSNTTGDTYETDSDIPAQSDGATVYYEIAATDDEPETTTSAEQSYDVNDPATATIPYSETFDTDLGDMYTYSVSGATKEWGQSGDYAEMNGFNSGDTEEDWMIFPGINLDNYSNEILTFDTEYRYGTDDADNYLKLMYSTDYSGSGDPSGSTWVELSYTQPGAAETWAGSGDVDLSGISGTSVWLAFKYRGTDGNYRRWRVDNISIEENTVVGEPTNHVTGFSATANSSSQITTTWTDAVGETLPDGYLVKAATGGNPTAPVDGTAESDGTLVKNIAHGSKGEAVFTGLDAETEYNFMIWSYTNAGSNIDYKTDGTIPSATATTEAAPVVPDLIISEVTDPNDVANAKYVELYNAGSTVIDLSGWSIRRYANGNTSSADVDLTSHSLAPNQTLTIAYNSTFTTEYGFSADIENGNISGNGDDVYELYDGSNVVDIYGEVGVDGTGEAWEYENSRAVRNSSVTSPNATWTASEWTITSADVVDMTPGEHNDYVSVKSDGDWNTASIWSNGSVPANSKHVVIPASNTVDIASGATAECNDLIVDGSLTIKSDATGTGSLIISGTASGSITSERYILGYPSSSGDGWHLLSSPVANQDVDGTSFEPVDGVDDFFAWDEVNYIWENHDQGGLTQFNAGEGYLVAYENTTTHQFTGTPNTADETETLTYTAGQGEGWNLLGNPFQSALQWDDGNWTLGDVQATAKIYDENDGNYDDIQNGGVDIIPANQGFFVKTTSAGSLTIPKAARVHDGTTFYKNTRASGGFLKLRIEAEENTFADEFTVWSNEGASDGYDSYDSEKFYGNAEAPQFYGVVNDDTYSTVSYQPAAIEDSRMVDLSLDAPEGEYSVSINTNTLASGTEIYIEDLLTDELINMNETELLSITVSENDPAERFVLHLNSTSVSNETLAEENSVKIYASNQQLYIDSENMIDDGKVTVYNTVGQVVAKEEMNGNTLSVNINERGTYIVTVRSDEGVSTRKVVIQ